MIIDRLNHKFFRPFWSDSIEDADLAFNLLPDRYVDPSPPLSPAEAFRENREALRGDLEALVRDRRAVEGDIRSAMQQVQHLTPR